MHRSCMTVDITHQFIIRNSKVEALKWKAMPTIINNSKNLYTRAKAWLARRLHLWLMFSYTKRQKEYLYQLWKLLTLLLLTYTVSKKSCTFSIHHIDEIIQDETIFTKMFHVQQNKHSDVVFMQERLYVTFRNKICVLHVPYRKNTIRVRKNAIAVVEELRFPSTPHI